MADRDRLRSAVSRLDVDPLDAAQERVRQASEQRTSAAEKRGIAARAWEIASAIARKVGLL